MHIPYEHLRLIRISLIVHRDNIERIPPEAGTSPTEKTLRDLSDALEGELKDGKRGDVWSLELS